ncbi:MAG: signal peptidase I [Chloroflexi bacterium HGW-Chloroflexi-3]|nr:MAG: signal peptidase I [Chloroflexi bacterium HGW-Chloroflexi-3]
MKIILPIIIIINLVLIRKSLLIVSVKGKSMTPTLQPDDRVLVFRYWPKNFLRKNNIVLISQKNENEERADKFPPCIKRITGLPGEFMPSRFEINIGNDENKFINSSDNLIIPEKHLFVQGDNYEKSIDSRHWGPIPYSKFLGVVVKRIK